MHQATRVRFHGGDPLALTRRIQARRPHPRQCEHRWTGHFRGAVLVGYTCLDCDLSQVRPRQQAKPAEKVTPLRIAGMVVFVIVMFVSIAITGPIFAAAVMGR